MKYQSMRDSLLQKLIVGFVCVLEGISIATLVADTVSMLMAPSVELGLGVALTAASAPLWVVGSFFAGLFIFGFIMFFTWKIYAKKAKKWAGKIDDEWEEKLTLLNALCQQQKNLDFMLDKKAKDQFWESIKNNFDLSQEQLSPVRVYFETRAKSDKSEFTRDDFVDENSENYRISELLFKTKPPKVALYPAVIKGTVMTLSAYASIIGLVSGNIGALTGFVPFLAALAGIPVVGWILLGLCLLSATGMGIMWGYYYHKNNRRKAMYETLDNANQQTRQCLNNTIIQYNAWKDENNEHSEKSKKDLLNRLHIDVLPKSSALAPQSMYQLPEKKKKRKSIASTLGFFAKVGGALKATVAPSKKSIAKVGSNL